MNNNIKNVIITSVAIVAIIISSLAIIISVQNTSQTNNQNIVQANTSHYNGEKREFWLFNSNIPEFNETQMGMPHDVFSMPTMAVFKGDNIVIHFFNTEELGGDHHSFTMFAKPYNINVALSPGENTTIQFNANTTGTFTYYCTFHQPTMRGQLIVQSPP